MKLRAWLGAVALAAGCLHPSAETCADGRVCPDGHECYETAAGEKLCLTPDQLTTCDALDDGADCTIDMREPGFCKDHVCLPGACGDGFRRGDEQCDGMELGPASEADCINYGYYYSKAPTCSAGCAYDLSKCVGRCGDNIVDTDFELCDGEDPARSCSDMGYGAGYLTCSDDCGPGLEDCKLFGWDQPGATDTNQAMRDIHGSDDNRVFAVGLLGAVYGFDGANWAEVDLSSCIASTQDAMSVWTFPDAVLVGFDNGAIVRVTDTGCAVSRAATVTSPATDPVTDIWAASASDVYAATANAVLHFDGTDWTTSSATAGLIRLWGTSADDVYAVGGTTVFHRTAGAWASVSAGVFSSVTAVWGGGPSDVYVGGLDNTMATLPLIRHFDGASWTTLAAPSSMTAIGAGGVAFGRVYVAGEVGTPHLFAYDGTTWNDLRWPSNAEKAWSLWMSPAGNAFVVANERRMYRFPGSARYEDPSVIGEPIAKIAAVSASEAYFITDDGAAPAGGDLYAWDGNVWSVDSVGLNTSSVHDISVASDGSVYIIETNAGLRKRNVGGGWSTAVSTTAGRLWAAGVNDVWLVTNGGGSGATVSHYNGATVSAPTQLTNFVQDIAGTSTSNIYAVGNMALIAHWDGVSWSTLPSPAQGVIWRAVAACGSDVFVGGTAGIIAHTSDGMNWTLSSLPQSVNPTAMWCSGPKDLFVAAATGFLFWFDGDHWSPVASGTADTITTVTGAGDMVFFGDDGQATHRIVRAIPW